MQASSGMHSNQYVPRSMTKSPVLLAEVALRCAEQALPRFSSPFSRRDYTQAQLFAILVMKAFFKTDYRGVIEYLRDWQDLRRTLGLSDDPEKLPHYSTLCYAERRLLKGGPSRAFRKPFLIEPGVWVYFALAEGEKDAAKASSILRAWRAVMSPTTTRADGKARGQKGSSGAKETPATRDEAGRNSRSQLMERAI